MTFTGPTCMADGSIPSDAPQGRIKREDADQVFIGALTCIAAGIHEGTDRELALQLVRRCLPLVSASTRIAALLPHAHAILAVAPDRLTRGGAGAWCSASMGLAVAIAHDGITRAFAKVEV
jgi:hypothetical protein